MARKKEAGADAVQPAGKIDSPVVVAAEKPHTASTKIGKLPKKDKSRLPRREKKALKKARRTAE
jgi:hypothetical protein